VDGRSSSERDAALTAADLTRERYPVGVRVLSDGARKQELHMTCIIDKNELIELPISTENGGLQKVRLSFSSGPIHICLGDVVVTMSDGEKIIIAHSELTHSAGIISHETHFEATGHQSHLHITLPDGSLDGITIEIKLCKNFYRSKAAVPTTSPKRLIDRLGLRQPKR